MVNDIVNTVVHPFALKDDSDDEDHVQVIIPSASRVEIDGVSGGFKAMRELPEYLEPADDDTDEHIDTRYYRDAIQNTVWRPRRTGEVETRIEIDEPFNASAKTDLEIHGGLDCGRSPYPVRNDPVPDPLIY